MENNFEKRFIELREVNDRTITGQAIVFGSESKDLGGFTEIIEPTAIDDTLINNSDIVMLYNHNEDDGILARSNKGKGTLKISIREDGVDFSFKAKNTAKGDEVLESVKNGDLSACSFAFRVASGGDKFEKRSDGSYLRTIKKIELLRDFSIVSNPAYEKTSVRSFDEFVKNEETRLEQETIKQLEEERMLNEKKELENYFNELENSIKEIIK